MMTSTASVQVNLEAGPQAEWARRITSHTRSARRWWRSRPIRRCSGGKFTGWRSSRQWVWSQLDSARCGPILGVTGEDPASDWARYAMKAPVMLVHPTPEIDAVPVTDWVPFADWADGRVLLGGRRPTVADLDYHLTTLFPPVRPRGFLEIRYLDSVPEARVAGRGLHPHHAARRSGCRRYRRRRHRTGRHRMGPRRADRPRRPAAAEAATAACRPPPSVHPPNSRNRCGGRAFGGTGTMSGRRLLGPGREKRHRHLGHSTGARGTVTPRETLAHRLTKARNRTLRLVAFDDAELHDSTTR